MKLIAAIYCLCMLLATAALFYASYNIERVSVAMTKMAEDNRDIFPKLLETQHRANLEIGQMVKDRIRIRELLKRLETKVNGGSKEKSGGSGGAEGYQGGTNRKATPVPKGKPAS